MAYSIWQRWITNPVTGQVQANASIRVLLESSGAVAAIASDAAGSPKDNPFDATDEAFAEFYAQGGAYKIEITKNGVTRTLRNVLIGAAAGYDVGPAAGQIPTNSIAATLYQALVLDNLSATVDPTVNDDSDDGYAPRSRWYNTVSGDLFLCVDATVGAAVWVLASLTTEDLGTMAIQDANNVAITGGTISGLASGLEVASGGTGATTAAGARSNLGLGTAAVEDSTAFATAAQGALAASAVQPGANVSLLNNDAQYITSAKADTLASYLVKRDIVGATHTVEASDLGKVLVFDTASAVTLTVPQQSTTALPQGFNFAFRNKNATPGAITVTPQGSDVVEGAGTVTNDSSKMSSCNLETAGAPNTWVTAGDMA